MKNYYLLTINKTKATNNKAFEDKLNKALDWIQVYPNTFLIESTSDTTRWLNRIKPVLGDNPFLLIKVDMKVHTGNLQKWIWEWITSKAKV